VTPQRRTALISVLAAVALIALKLATGIVTHSLGLLSEAAHSGTDLVAALLTFFAVGVAARPADVGHQYGHGKAEHLSALGEASILVLASLLIVWRSIARLAGTAHPHVDAAWYALSVIGIVILLDVTRTFASWRAARQYHSAALASNALHFGTDLGGSVAVLVGLLFVRAGYPDPRRSAPDRLVCSRGHALWSAYALYGGAVAAASPWAAGGADLWSPRRDDSSPVR